MFGKVSLRALVVLIWCFVVMCLHGKVEGSRCEPDQLEFVALGKDERTIGETPPFVLNLMLNISRDFANKKEIAIQTPLTADSDGKAERLSIIRDFNKMEQWVVYPDIKKCKKGKLNHPMRRFCTEEGTLLSSIKVAGQMADVYSYMPHDTVHALKTMFRDAFVPLSKIYQERSKTMSRMMALQFGDMAEGINDASIFSVPTYCRYNTSTVDEKRAVMDIEDLFFDTALL